MRSVLLAVCSRVMFLNLVLCEHCQYSSSRKHVKSQNENNVFQGVSDIANLHQQYWILGQYCRPQVTLPYMQSKQIQEAATVAYIEDQFKSEDPMLIQSAAGNLARLYGMTTLSQLTGLARPSLYRSLCENGNPSFQTMCRILDAMGYTVSVRRKEQKPNE